VVQDNFKNIILHYI